MGLFHVTSKVAATAAAAFLLALPFTPVITAWAATSGISMGIAPTATSDPTQSCKPDNDNDFDNNQESDNNNNDDKDDRDDKGNKHCPPPVVPEAPITALLPISAGALLGGAYVVARLRGRSQASG